MATRRTGLGRGIGALIPTQSEGASTERPVDVFFPDTARSINVESTAQAESNEQADLKAVPGAQLVGLSPSDIIPNANQPRRNFDPDDLAELVHSIREFGVLQPIVVRTHDAEKGVYELIMGERRLRAAKEAGLDSIPAVIKDTSDDAMLRDALLENLHRSELNPLEEASAYQQLLEDFGITQEQLADRIGRSRPQITNTIRLLRLPTAVQSKVAAGVLSAGHARTILSVSEPDLMERLAAKIVNEDLSVRAAEEAAKRMTASSRPKPKPGARRGQLDSVGERLGDRLNTRVKVTLGSKKGQIVVDFATIGDLNRILEEIGEDPYSG
ncbi:ParB/RepB/Spo0J family partition protein [Paramicrobacterium agarici]|uniref:ParB family chromosome partitioning protein n=1 Tax=Paramicrobacterium agarici TaxID=630514 RepID=A0A2A9DSM7_9MICO|nr:ParB/RepB/Spo0J family partition protein [Microbacterium agarici]PFG29688.1 ParB family chromosome partitioning protein [Microbacterium agarici]TQO22719.1 ParB family chromosome partitioning protein [Microbacterium agarici]